MTTPRLIVAGFAAALALGACGNKQSSYTGSSSAAPASDAGSFEHFASSMVGTFTNAEQAKERDSAGNPIWMNVELHIVEITAPQLVHGMTGAHPGGRWFYVEQAEVGVLDKPFRQHVSNVRENANGGFSSTPYTFTGDPLRFAGWWRTPEAFTHHLTPADLEARPGCEVEIRPQGEGRYAGGTVGTGCTNTSKGAAYATSQVVFAPGEIRAWDRGFDASGRQVWGSRTGPYIFKRTY